MVIKTIEKSTELIVILIFSPQLFRSSSSMNSLWMGVLAKLHTFLSWHFWMFLGYLGLAFDILIVHGRFYIFFLSWFTCTLTFQSVPPANSRLAPLPPEPYDRGATIDIPLDSAQVSVHIHDVELPCSIYAVFEQFFFSSGWGVIFLFNSRICKQRRRNSKQERPIWKGGNRWFLILFWIGWLIYFMFHTN